MNTVQANADTHTTPDTKAANNSNDINDASATASAATTAISERASTVTEKGASKRTIESTSFEDNDLEEDEQSSQESPIKELYNRKKNGKDHVSNIAVVSARAKRERCQLENQPAKPCHKRLHLPHSSSGNNSSSLATQNGDPLDGGENNHDIPSSQESVPLAAAHQQKKISRSSNTPIITTAVDTNLSQQLMREKDLEIFRLRAQIRTKDVMIRKMETELARDVTRVSFDSSTTEIPRCAFAHRSNLKNTIWGGTFSHAAADLCSDLAIAELQHFVAVSFNVGLQKIGKYAFAGCEYLETIELPSTIIELGVGAFCCCKRLSKVVLNEGLTKIPNGAFAGCISLTSINLPSTVTEVGARAFLHCRHLSKVALSQGLQTIKSGAFLHCYSLNEITLNEGLHRIQDEAFADTNLREVTISAGLERFNSTTHPQLIPLSIKSCAFPFRASVKFPAISRRMKDLIAAGQKFFELFNLTNDIVRAGENAFEQIPGFEHLEWRGEELLGSPDCIRSSLNWVDTRRCLEILLKLVQRYELKEATTLLELALWKASINNVGANSSRDRIACRPGIFGPMKEAILGYLVGRPSDVPHCFLRMQYHYVPLFGPGILYSATTEPLEEDEPNYTNYMEV